MLSWVSDDSTIAIPSRDASVTVTQSEADVEIMVKSSYDSMDEDGEPIRVTKPPAIGFPAACGTPISPGSSSATFKDGVLRVQTVATTELCGEVTTTLEAEHKLRPV